MTYNRLVATPTGLIPPLDRAYLIVALQLPPGSTLDRTDAVIRRASDIILTRPGATHSVAFVGFDGATFTNAPNTGVIFVNLAPFEERVASGLTKDRILNDLRQQMSKLKEALYSSSSRPPFPASAPAAA